MRMQRITDTRWRDHDTHSGSGDWQQVSYPLTAQSTRFALRGALALRLPRMTALTNPFHQVLQQNPIRIQLIQMQHLPGMLSGVTRDNDAGLKLINRLQRPFRNAFSDEIRYRYGVHQVSSVSRFDGL